MANKIGIMGGSFDPIHLGHLIVAESALEEFSLDKVIFIPTGTPPHKDKSKMSSNLDRYNMTALSIEDNPKYEISSIEVKNKHTSYTIDTLKTLQKQYPKSEIYFIMGLDSFKNLESWKGYKEILEEFKIIIADRLDSEDIKAHKKYQFYREKYPGNIFLLGAPIIGLSSTRIREKVAKGLSIRYLVKKEVSDYIDRENLYR